MHKQRQLILTFIVVPLIVGLVFSPIIKEGVPSSFRDDLRDSDIQAPQSNPISNSTQPERAYALSQDTQSGIIDPVSIKQSGYQSIDAQRARTDTGTNSITNITIDESNDWFVNYTEVEVWDIKKLYGVNGTFENGVSPWTNYTIDGGSNTQITDYDSENEYIVCRNVGQYNYHPVQGVSYIHSGGTEIGYQQVVDNPSGKLNFKMKLDFRFATGPIDPDGDNGLPGYIGVFYQVASDGWYLPMETTVTSRSAWYTLTHDFTIPTPWSSFSIYVGLWLAGDIEIFNNTDYDDDPLGLPDGQANAQNLTLCLDNIEFTGAETPSFESVDLTFHAGLLSAPILGTSIGTASVSNPSFWDVNPLQVQVSANTSVIFTYSVTSLFHRLVNSSWTPNPTKHGVLYDISSGESSNLAFFSYITQPSNYENYTVDIIIPKDWENTTIWDPLRTNITDLCDVTPGRIHVPNSEVSRSGWWEIDLQGFNYAKNISSQIYDEIGESWAEGTQFKTTNSTRTQIEIGTATSIPSGDYPVNITWILPNGTIWIEDNNNPMISGVVTSSVWNFGATNTSAGVWEIDVVWINGTEIAFATTTFSLYHSAAISVNYPSISTDYGLVISNLVTYKDDDTDDFLLDDSVLIEANWSNTVVSFSANQAKNWWEADFDTSLLRGGEYIIIINASRPFYNNVSCSFTVTTTFLAQMDLPNIGVGGIETELNERYVIDIEYTFSNGTGIEGATITFSFSGSSAGLVNESATDLGEGNYSLGFTGILSGDYSITISVSKNYHQSDSMVFSLTVGEVSTFLNSMNGSAALVELGSDYRLVLNYTNSTGDGLVGSTVLVTQVSPSSGLTIGSVADETNGFYSITLTPTLSSTFTVVLRANITNHVTQYVTFTIIVTDIQTTLTPHSTSGSTLINQSYVLQLTYEDSSFNGIPGATITLVNLPSGLSYSVDDIGGGVYNVTLTPSVIEAKSFQLSFRAVLANYETSSTSFTLLVQLVDTDLIVFDGPTSGSVEVFQQYSFILSFIRLDQTLNITGATISIETSPSTGLTTGVQEIGELYYINFTGNNIGIWHISVTASRSSYVQAVLLLELEVLAISTSFTSLNGTADAVGFGLDYTLALNYSTYTGYGLTGATVQTISVSPATGLIVGTTSDLGNGIFTITLTPSTSNTFTISLRGNITNHITQYLTFTLMVTDVATVLIPDSVGATISIDQNHTLLLTYEDEASNPIIGATIILLNPPAGLAYSIDEIGGGVYNVSLDPLVTEATSFQLSFRASLENYQSASTAFSLFVQKIPTSLDILQGSTSAEMVVIDSYSLLVAYIRTDSNANITSADLTITTSPIDGLSAALQDIGEIYLITFTASRVGVWQITISANRTNFVTSLIQIELEVTPIDTTLVCLNGTADLTQLNTLYKLSLLYENSTGDGISLATILSSEITPASGLSVNPTIAEGNGIYSITFNASIAATYTIVVRANATNHLTQYITFSLTILPVETVLIPHVSGATISIDKEFLLQLTFQDEYSTPLIGATIEIVELPDGLTYVVVEHGSGIYNVTLTPSVAERTSFQISFRASMPYYQSSTTAFSLLVREIPTNLVIIDGVAFDSIQYTDIYEVWVAFVRTDTNENVTGATLDTFFTPAMGIESEIMQVGDLYHLIFYTNTTGTWQISVKSNKTGYESHILSLELEVNEIDTTLNQITLLEALVFSHDYNFTLEYKMENSTRIREASITISGAGSDWVIVEEGSSGVYLLSLVPQDIGNYEITLEFSRNGFTTRTSTLTFSVRRVVVSIVDIQGLSGLEGQLTQLSLRVIETESLTPISGATVAFQIIVNGVTSTSVIMDETEAGRYTSSFIMPSADSDVKIRLYVDKENHRMEQDLEFREMEMTPTISELTALTRTFVNFSPLILLAAVMTIGYQVRRSLTKRERKQNLEALAVKRRFDDVRNMVGVVVLHRESGIPVYSRMLRAGFDDSLISAFITAISQFRSEFDVGEKEWQITPISDIIMAVKTQNLVCAFITMGSPTPTQQERMIQFAKSVGFVFDSNFEEAPVLTIDDITEERFDELFDELLDMNLHQKHKIIDIKGLPKGPKCLNQTITEFKSLESFDLNDMADRMAACGIEEARAYKIILDAIKSKQMIPVEFEGEEILPDITDEIITPTSDDAETDDTPLDDEIAPGDRFVDEVEALLKSDTKDISEDTDNTDERLDL